MDLPDTIPLFPLPDHVLLIGLPTPYRVFEPRYRTLVDDLLGRKPSERWLAIPRLADGWEGTYESEPAIHPIAALGLARNIRPLEEGRFMLVAEGMMRCRLEEVVSPHAYRLARPMAIADQPSAGGDGELTTAVARILGQVAELRRRLGSRGAILAPLLENQTDIAALVDRLAAALLADVEDRQAVLEAPTVTGRATVLHRGLGELLGSQKRSWWDPSAN